MFCCDLHSGVLIRSVFGLFALQHANNVSQRENADIDVDCSQVRLPLKPQSMQVT